MCKYAGIILWLLFFSPIICIIIQLCMDYWPQITKFTLKIKLNFMHTPTSKQILTVINNFKKVLPLATREWHLNMSETRVNNCGHKCGTIHCHAGWYAIAKNLHEKREVSFTHGAIQMSIDLGHKGDMDSSLINWADKNPEIWGNNDGDGMFSTRRAFSHPTKRPEGAENLQHIIDHWTEVYERVLAIENKEPERKDITKELAILPVNETADTKNKITEHANLGI